MKINNYNKIDKEPLQTAQKQSNQHTCKDEGKQCSCKSHETYDYSFYSRVLGKPFDSLEELKAEEAKYFAAQRAKEDQAAQKKADAKKVEEAFRALNTARKAYKEGITSLTERYSADLKKLKEAFETDKKEMSDLLAAAEEAYSMALKAFTEKYDSYHMTLKDGDFETTISGSRKAAPNTERANDVFDLFDYFFKF
jgi:chromosome segregation ATPase